MPQKPGCEINPVGRPREENILTSANDLTKNIKRVIFTEEEIKAKIAEELLKKRGPLSLEVITLLDKPSRRAVEFKADKALFTIPDYFVIGYGLDCGEKYRNLPYIAEYSAD